MEDNLTERFRAETLDTISNLEHLVSSTRFEEPDTIHRLFRAVHSLKSEAASRDLRNVAQRANTLETYLSRLRSGDEEVGAESRDEILRALEELAELLETGAAQPSYGRGAGGGNGPPGAGGPAAGGQAAGGSGFSGGGTSPPDTGSQAAGTAPGSRAAFGGAAVAAGRAGAAGRAPEAGSGAARRVIGLTEQSRKLVLEAVRRGEQLWQLSCRVNESAEMLYPRLYLAVSNLEQSLNVIQTEPPLEQIPADLREFSALLSGPEQSDPIHKALSIDGIEDVRVTPVSADALTDAIPAGNDRALKLDEQVSIGAAQVEELRLYADELQYQLNQLEEAPHEAAQSRPGAQGEQGRARFELAQKLTKTLVHELSRHSQVDLSTLLSRVVGTAEADAQAQHKRVRVHTEGTGNRLFLPVAEVLGESILHLVRNAVAHGIEPIEERRRLGKPDVGRIQVSVSRAKAAGVTVHVTDDGAGIALEGSTEELLEQLSVPGFSTKATADERAGRGVGLDVVRYNVERLLGGTVALEWNQPGEGCSFVLRIPNPGTVLGVLVVRSGRQHLAIPRVYVQTRRRIGKEQLATDNTGAYFFRHGSTYLRVVTPAGARLAEGGNKWAVVLRLPTRRVALIVDECISEELVVRGSSNRSEVYSKSLDQTVQLFLPLRFL